MPLPVVTTALARWLQGLRERRHTFRIVFIPESAMNRLPAPSIAT